MADWSALREASRVNVVGTSGSGKSTFARRLATLRNLPYVEMDQLYWKADWEEPDRRDYHARIETVVAEPEWVLDGNYRRTCPIKWPRTEVMVFLDLPLLLTVQRLIRRSWQRGTSGQELWPGTGNRETLRRSFFSSDSVIWWGIINHARNRRRYDRQTVLAAYPHLHIVHLQSPRDVTDCLAALAAD